MGVLFIPFQYYYCGLNFTIGSLLGLLLMTSIIILIGLKFLTETNNPLTKFNPLSINPMWKNINK